MPVSGPAADSGKRARRLALMIVLLVLVLFLGLKRLIEEEQRSAPAWSNRLTPAEHVSGRAPLELTLTLPGPEAGDAPALEAMLATRVDAVNARRDWLAEPYRPHQPLFADLPDVRPEEWSDAVVACVSNPFLLLSFDAVHAPAKVMPVALTWWPHEARVEARFHVTTPPRGSAPLRLLLVAFNALDFGLSHVQLRVDGSPPGEVLQIPPTLASHDADWLDPEAAVVTVRELPTTVSARLWSSAPAAEDAMADLRVDLVVEAVPR